MKLIHARTAVVVGSSWLLAAVTSQAQSYRATYLGNYTNSSIYYGHLNQAGQSAMDRYYSENATDRRRATAISADGSYRTLSWLKDGSGNPLWTDAFANFSSRAYDINDAGVVVGGASVGTTSSVLVYQPEAFKTSAGVTLRLSSPAAGDMGFTDRFGAAAFGVNNLGEAVGTADGTGTRSKAPVYWSAEGTPSVLSLPGAVVQSAWAWKINDEGIIVGSTLDTGGLFTGIVWRNGVPTALGNFGGTESEALGINNQWIVGYAEDSSFRRRAFRLSTTLGASMQNLGALATNNDSLARDVNSSGTVVGESSSEAFVWTAAGGMQNLENLDDITQDYDEAVAINDRGFIIARSGADYFMLRPVGWAGRWVPAWPAQGWGTPKAVWANPGTEQLAFWNMTPTGAYSSTGFIVSYPLSWDIFSFDAMPNSTGFVFWRGTANDAPNNLNKVAAWGLNTAGQIAWGREYALSSQFTCLAAVGDPATGGFQMLHSRNSDNTLVLWKADATGLVAESYWLSAIPSGWWLTQMAVSPNGKTWLYFSNSVTRQYAVWRLSSGGVFEQSYVFGALPDWDLVDVTFTVSSEPYLWWRRKADAQLHVWRCTSDGLFASGYPIQNAPGWTFVNAASDFVNDGHTVFWIDQNNQLAVWNLNGFGVFQSGGTSGMVQPD